jgi:hypothetical protein
MREAPLAIPAAVAPPAASASPSLLAGLRSCGCSAAGLGCGCPCALPRNGIGRSSARLGVSYGLRRRGAAGGAQPGGLDGLWSMALRLFTAATNRPRTLPGWYQQLEQNLIRYYPVCPCPSLHALWLGRWHRALPFWFATIHVSVFSLCLCMIRSSAWAFFLSGCCVTAPSGQLQSLWFSLG